MFYTQPHNVIGIFIIFFIFHPSREIFTSCWIVTIVYEGLQIQTYDLHSRPMRNEGYNCLVFHTFCNTGHLLFRLSTRSCEFHDWRRAFDRGSFSTCFIWRLMSQTGFEHPTFCMRDESFTSYVIYYSLLNMDKIASLEESHNQGDVNPKNMNVLQQTRDVEEEPIAICHIRELKGAKKIFFQTRQGRR